MKIAITGGSGFVGNLLIPKLKDMGHEILLLSRTPSHSSDQGSGTDAATYAELESKAANFDLLLHCAVANSDSRLSEAEIFAVNVDFAQETARAAKRANIRSFVLLSSVHALDGHNQTAYARSKREAKQALEETYGDFCTTVYLPLIYGERWAGKLSWLNNLPTALAKFLFKPLASLKPTAHIQLLADWIDSQDFRVHPSPDDAILFDDQSKNIYYYGVKRAIDVCFSVAVIFFLWWALTLIWIIIKKQSPGPGIFSQKRVGLKGKTFICYKFRTMQLGTKQAGTHEVSASSVTPFGAFLRKTKLDELPQVWNILRNEISLIGPRPCLPVQTELIAARQQRSVFNVKPGISGLAQINDVDMSDPQKLSRLDFKYYALRSTILDLKIAIATATGKGQGDKVA